MILVLVLSSDLTPTRSLPPQAAEALAALRPDMVQAAFAVVVASAWKYTASGVR